MWSETAFSHLTGIKYPIVQAPMQDITTVQLVANMSNSGCLGMFPAHYLSGKELKKVIRQIRSVTSQPFGIHVQLPRPNQESELRQTTMFEVLKPVYEQLGLKWKKMPKSMHLPFTEQIETIIHENVRIISFAPGVLDSAWIARLNEASVVTIGYATSKYEAKALQESDIDVICLQGLECAGDRFTFLGRDDQFLEPLDRLISDCNPIITKPMIAYGDIMNGADVKRCMQLGASGVQLSSAVITTNESGACEIYKKILLNQKDLVPTLSRAFKGKLSRIIPNALSEYLERYPFQILEYPHQEWILSDIFSEAIHTNNPNFLFLAAGTNFANCRKCSISQLIEEIIREIEINN